MGRLANYYTTAKDLASKKITLSDAYKVAKETPGGLLNPTTGKIDNVAKKTVVKGDTDKKNETPLDEESGTKLKDITSSDSYNSTLNKEKENFKKNLYSGWDDADDLRSNVKDEVEKINSQIGGLTKARDSYLKANDENLSKKNTAIAGNKELISKNQKTDLDSLADTVRNQIFNTNLSLGVLGASNSSASGAAAKALSKSAGKDRKTVLEGYGDQISGQKQEEQNAIDYYNLQRKNAYEWEERQKKIAQEEYELNKKVLSKLKDKLPDWKQDDLEDENDNNLSNFMGQLAEISAQSRAFRDTLNSWLTEMGSSTMELESANIDIDAPPELDTPEFTDELNIDGGEEEEDFYNPNIKDKKKEGSENDILSNPLIFE